jgi:hypothetical protein
MDLSWLCPDDDELDRAADDLLTNPAQRKAFRLWKKKPDGTFGLTTQEIATELSRGKKTFSDADVKGLLADAVQVLYEHFKRERDTQP